VDLVPDTLLLRKSGSGGNRTRDLWVCSQELLPNAAEIPVAAVPTSESRSGGGKCDDDDDDDDDDDVLPSRSRSWQHSAITVGI
jgi:hypothetical protein